MKQFVFTCATFILCSFYLFSFGCTQNRQPGTECDVKNNPNCIYWKRGADSEGNLQSDATFKGTIVGQTNSAIHTVSAKVLSTVPKANEPSKVLVTVEDEGGAVHYSATSEDGTLDMTIPCSEENKKNNNCIPSIHIDIVEQSTYKFEGKIYSDAKSLSDALKKHPGFEKMKVTVKTGTNESLKEATEKHPDKGVVLGAIFKAIKYIVSKCDYSFKEQSFGCDF